MDHVYAKIPEEKIREHFDTILDKMHSFLANEDADAYRSFAGRYVALRVGEGFSHESLIHLAVAIGDVIAQVARAKLYESAHRELFVRAVMRMNFAHARMLVSLLAEDLADRLAQRSSLARRDR